MPVRASAPIAIAQSPAVCSEVTHHAAQYGKKSCFAEGTALTFNMHLVHIPAHSLACRLSAHYSQPMAVKGQARPKTMHGK
jgi:hypothetical protein